MEQDLLIVGAGPSGLALAAELRSLGVSAMIIDRQAAGANTSRACVVHARTLEVLAPMGVTAAVSWTRASRSRYSGFATAIVSLVTIDFAEIASAYPFTLMCPQDRDRACAACVAATPRRQRRAASGIDRISNATEPASSPASLRMERTRTVRSRWLVGCDGMHSRVRELANIAFEGAMYEQGFVLADVRMDWPLSSRRGQSLLLSEGTRGGRAVAGRSLSHRCDGRRGAGSSVAAVCPGAARCAGPGGKPGPAFAISSGARASASTIGSLVRPGTDMSCCAAMRRMSTARPGGQGMNTGIQDAISLAHVLAKTLQDGDEARLDEWAAARHRIATDVVALTDRITRMATMKSPVGQSLRNAALVFAGHIPPVRAAFARKLAELDAR